MHVPVQGVGTAGLYTPTPFAPMQPPLQQDVHASGGQEELWTAPQFAPTTEFSEDFNRMLGQVVPQSQSMSFQGFSNTGANAFQSKTFLDMQQPHGLALQPPVPVHVPEVPAPAPAPAPPPQADPTPPPAVNTAADAPHHLAADVSRSFSADCPDVSPIPADRTENLTAFGTSFGDIAAAAPPGFEARHEAAPVPDTDSHTVPNGTHQAFPQATAAGDSAASPSPALSDKEREERRRQELIERGRSALRSWRDGGSGSLEPSPLPAGGGGVEAGVPAVSANGVAPAEEAVGAQALAEARQRAEAAERRAAEVEGLLEQAQAGSKAGQEDALQVAVAEAERRAALAEQMAEQKNNVAASLALEVSTLKQSLEASGAAAAVPDSAELEEAKAACIKAQHDAERWQALYQELHDKSAAHDQQLHGLAEQLRDAEEARVHAETAAEDAARAAAASRQEAAPEDPTHAQQLQDHYTALLEQRDAEITRLSAKASEAADLQAELQVVQEQLQAVAQERSGDAPPPPTDATPTGEEPALRLHIQQLQDYIEQLQTHYQGILQEKDAAIAAGVPPPAGSDEEAAAAQARVAQLEEYIKQLQAHYDGVVLKQQEELANQSSFFEENIKIREKELQLGAQEASLLAQEKGRRVEELEKECGVLQGLHAENHRLALRLQQQEALQGGGAAAPVPATADAVVGVAGETTAAQELHLLRSKEKEWDLERERLILFQRRIEEESAAQREKMADMSDELDDLKAKAAAAAAGGVPPEGSGGSGAEQPDYYVAISSETDPQTGVRINTEVKRPLPSASSPTAAAQGGVPLPVQDPRTALAKGTGNLPFSVMLFEAIFSLGGILPSTRHATPKSSRL